MYSNHGNTDPEQVKALLPLVYLHERLGTSAEGQLPMYIGTVRASFGLETKRDHISFQIDDIEESMELVTKLLLEKWAPMTGTNLQILRTQYVHRKVMIGYNDDVIEFMIAYGGDNSGIGLTFVGKPAWVDYNMDFIRANIEDTAIRMLVPHVEDDTIQITRQRVPLETLEPELPTCHYPYMPLTPEKLIEDFMASDANVLVLIGPPGTGKSTWLRAMLHGHYRYQKKDDNDEYTTHSPYLIADQAVLQHKNLVSFVRKRQSRTNPALFVFEDADALVEHRTNGNEVMSAILNILDGIIKTRLKMIVSTNLPGVDKIDEALIRPGRCFGVFRFGKLTPEQAADVRAHYDKPPMPDNKSSFSLAEVLNYTEEDSSRRIAPIFGFK